MPGFSGLRLKVPDVAGFLVAIGFILMAFGATSAFWIDRIQPNSKSLPLNANNNPLEGRTNASTPTAEVYLALALPENVATQIPPGLLASQGMAQEQTQPATIYKPEWIRIPIIKLDAPVVSVLASSKTINGDQYLMWKAPDKYAAGWHNSSATLGVPGNTVLNGHNNIYGEVFRRLADLKIGDRIQVGSGSMVFVYKVSNKMTLEENKQSLGDRLEHARWLQPTDDERLTLVTCWPYWSNQYRLVLVARRVDQYVESDQ
ncbi:MAG: sortase [Anaerolineaceae bacterium]|nr:sortase [Anaerolineaceae bacterium]